MSDTGNPTDYSPPGSSVHGIFQARILEWVAISFLPDAIVEAERSHNLPPAWNGLPKTVVSDTPSPTSSVGGNTLTLSEHELVQEQD